MLLVLGLQPLSQSTNSISGHPSAMASKISPVAIPNASRECHGWCIDGLGVFYIHKLEYKSALPCISVLSWLDVVEEIVSDSLDQSLQGSFEKSELGIPYSSHYYWGIFDMYAILNQSLLPPPPGLDHAIRSHPQFEGGPTIHPDSPPELAGFLVGF